MTPRAITEVPAAGHENRAAGRKPEERLGIAIVCASAQWFLALAIQIGDLFGYLLPPAARNVHSCALLAGAIPLLQTQNIAAAALFGVLAYFASRNRITAWILFALCCAENVGLLLDQVYYKIFLDHVHLGMIDGGEQFNPVIFLSSFIKEADWIFVYSTAVAVAGSVWFARALRTSPRHPARLRAVAAIAAAAALVGIPKVSATSYGHVNAHPLIALTRELQQRSIAEILTRRARTEPRRPDRSFDRTVDRDPRLAAFLAAGHPRKPQPNLVVIVMESVGAVDLLGPDGLPEEKITPNLARLARGGVIFNSIYTTFPGTTRSLVSLHTGGRQFTSGRLDELDPPFTAPLLARRFRNLGYATALFSSERLDGESTDIFLEKAGYQKYYDFSRDTFENRKKYELSSWGGREEYAVGLMADWVARTETGKPFYLEYITTATHHPYNVPAEYRGPVAPKDRHAEYLNALNYSDHAIGLLLEFLDRRGLLKNTVIAVTGDHGEAFGDLHGSNFLHKNFIYDENVRDFFLLWDGQIAARRPQQSAIVSSRVGKNGDIMPTLLALVDEEPADVPGRNLLTAGFESQPVFFHKIAPPEMMGLRDGRWKFIDEIRSNRSELYDLGTDPTEQTNLAAAHADMISEYRAMCRQWYLESEVQFVAWLDKTPTPAPFRDARGTLASARTLTVGRWDRNIGPSSFVEDATVHPDQHVAVWTKWVADADPQAVYEWISPSGQIFFSRPLLTGEPHISYSPLQGQDNLETGAWSVRLRVAGGFRLEAQFKVTAGARISAAGRRP